MYIFKLLLRESSKILDKSWWLELLVLVEHFGVVVGPNQRRPLWAHLCNSHIASFHNLQCLRNKPNKTQTSIKKFGIK